MGSVETKPGRNPALLKIGIDSLSPVVPSLSEALQPFAAVIVTGGSSGIGKSFIQTLAKLRPDLVVCNLSRRSPAEKISANLRKKLNHISCDLSQPGEIPRVVAGVRACLDREAPGGGILLINNSGFGTFGPLHKLNLERELQMVDLNIRAVVHLTGLLLPLLLERGGAILNLASTAAYQPTAFAATYGASKTFVLHWTLALDEELRGTRVRALALCPGTTSTLFFENAGVSEKTAKSSLTLTPEQVVDAALCALAARRSHVVPGFWNKVYTFAAAKLPKMLATRIAGRIFRRRWEEGQKTAA